MKFFRGFTAFIILTAYPFGLRAQDWRALYDGDATAGADTPEHAEADPHALYLKVQLPASTKLRALKPGQTIAGELWQPVYSGNQQLFPIGSQITLTVQAVQRCRRPYNDHWPWVVNFFAPRHENCPAFEAGRAYRPGGEQVPLRLSLIAIAREKHVRVQLHGKEGSSATPHGAATQDKATPAKLILTLQASATLPQPMPKPISDELSPSEGPAGTVLAAGTPAKIVLLDSLSASKSRAGDVFRARLIEPVMAGSAIALPEGSILEGQVAKVVPPRIFSRSGTLLLNFNQLIPPEASLTTVSAFITGGDFDQRSRTNIDSEGALRGARPGKLWTLINLGATAGMAKGVDDGTQLIIQAIVSIATDASTAGTARIAAACVSGLFMLTRHGRDVVLPRFTQMDIVFNRSVSIPSQSSHALPQPLRKSP